MGVFQVICVFFLCLADYLLIASAESTTPPPKPGSSWMVDEEDFNQNCPEQNKLNWSDEDVVDAFSTYVCDEVAEKALSPKTQISETRAFEKLKAFLEIKLNSELSNEEIKRRIKYFNKNVCENCDKIGRDTYASNLNWHHNTTLKMLADYVRDVTTEINSSANMREVKTKAFKELKEALKNVVGMSLADAELLRRIRYYRCEMEAARQQRCRNNWELPAANSALAHYIRKIQVMEQLSHVRLTRKEIVETDAFKTLKCSMERLTGRTYDTERFYNDLVLELNRNEEKKPQILRPADFARIYGILKIDWNHPQVARAFAVYENEFDAEAALSPVILRGPRICYTTAFRRLKRALEQIFNCEFTESLLYDYLMEHICRLEAEDESFEDESFENEL